MQLRGKINRLAVYGQVWFGFHFVSSLFGSNSGRFSVGLALVCFSALLSILEVLVLCSFDGLGFKEVSGRRKLSLGEQILGNKPNLVLFSK